MMGKNGHFNQLKTIYYQRKIMNLLFKLMLLMIISLIRRRNRYLKQIKYH